MSGGYAPPLAGDGTAGAATHTMRSRIEPAGFRAAAARAQPASSLEAVG
jgi:hypothetical protein